MSRNVFYEKSKSKIVVNDRIKTLFKSAEIELPIYISFRKVDILNENTLRIDLEEGSLMLVAENLIFATVDEIALVDKRHHDVWGEKILKATLVGSGDSDVNYTISIVKE
ncbi:hypothetical protein [Vibrio maritimus]|uniref:hypothetical protein n=1 Tax=Vibrio maritimus TaxID=990268 RepID=UPI00373692EB